MKPFKDTPGYTSWRVMKKRCDHDPRYKNIEVCERWRYSFKNFISDMGEPNSGHSIERIDNRGPYSPENCRWATHKEQCRNRRNNKVFYFKGASRPLVEICEMMDSRYQLVNLRLHRGWDLAQALCEPNRKPQRTVAL